MFEATPDFRSQWYLLDMTSEPAVRSESVADSPGGRDWRAAARSVPNGIFLTHAHIGHYTGLMFLGHESVGASNVPVYTFPGMADFLSTNGPWDQLVRYDNIELRILTPNSGVTISPNLTVEAFHVPHRQEYSDVAGYRIHGPNRTALFIPDIDSWEAWDGGAIGLETELKTADIAFLDATFFDGNELPGRDMSDIPHPFALTTMERLSSQPSGVKSRVYFIHLNHTNPLLDPASPESRQVRAAGFNIARRGMRFSL